MLSRWQSTIVDAQGNVQPLANLTVRNEADQSLAKMWASPGTSQPLPDGMVQADGNGYAFFYARGGLYRITSATLGIDWRGVQIGAALVSIGDYAAGLEITARNQIFWRDGELYRAGAVLELPYTTTGDWGSEEGLFVAVGDQALRQELAAPLGAGKVGFNESAEYPPGSSGSFFLHLKDEITASIKYDEGPIYNIARFGIPVNGVDDATDLFNNFLSNVEPGSLIVVPPGTVRINDILYIQKEGVSIQGFNRMGCTIRHYGEGPVFRSSTKGEITIKNTHLSDLLIMKDSSAPAGGSIIDLGSMQFSTLERLRIFGTNGQQGIQMSAVLNQTEGSYNSVRDSTINTNGDCISIINVANSNLIDNVRMQPSLAGTYGVRIATTDGTYVNNIRIMNCGIEYPGRVVNGIAIGADVDGVTIIGNRFESLGTAVNVINGAGRVYVPRAGNYFSSCDVDVNRSGSQAFLGQMVSGRFNAASGAVSIVNRSGYGSISRVSAGIYTVSAAPGYNWGNISVTATSGIASTEAVSIGASSFQIRTRDSAGTYTDADAISFVGFG